MDLYREEVMDHYEHPRNQGELAGDDVLTGRDSNASCGDMIQFYIRLRVNAKTRQREIAEVKWKGIGCAITTASASKLSEYLVGKKVDDVKSLEEQEFVEQGIGFEVNPGRIKCLTLPVKVIKKLLTS